MPAMAAIKATLLATVLVVALALLSIDVSRPSYACSCAQRPPEELFDGAVAVFAGQVTAIAPHFNSYDVTFDVYRYWKGLSESDKTVAVWTISSSAACGYPFEEGEEYLTYASKSGDALEVGLCGGTQPLAHADDRLSVLGAGIVPHDSGPILPDDVAIGYVWDASSALLIAAVVGLSAGIAVLIFKKPKI